MPQGYGNKQVNIRIESELLAQIESKAGEAKISPADWIRNAIRSALGQPIPGAITRLEFEKAIAALDERIGRLELAGAKQLLAGEVIKPEPKPKKVPVKFTPTPSEEETELVKKELSSLSDDGLTASRLAEILGVSQLTVGKWKKDGGVTPPTLNGGTNKGKEIPPYVLRDGKWFPVTPSK
jgi:hypothetical protein